MIEENGVVVSLKGEWAVVEPETSSGCSSCSANQGCGTASLARFFGQRKQQHFAHNPLNAQPGDRVIMGLQEKALVSGSILMYLLPLICMIVGAILFSSWVIVPGLDADATASLGLGVGLVLGLGLTRWLSHRMRKQLYPIIMRIQTGSR